MKPKPKFLPKRVIKAGAPSVGQAHDAPPVDIEPELTGPEQPFVEGAADTLDPDLRHRLISETAFHHLEERGFADGSEVEDWAQAEAEVDHTLINPAEPSKGSD